VRPEWNIELSRGGMDQVEELLDTIAAHKLMGVTGASVMFSFFKRRVQPTQQRHILGFEYKDTEDPSRMCTEELSDEATLLRVKRVLLDMDAVPYVHAAVRVTESSETGKYSTTFVENELCFTATN
jgi:hypothetical protein